VSGSFDRPLERSLRLLAGLVLFGLAMALLIESQAGLDPWNVFHQGVTEHVELTIGEVTVLSSLALLALWVPLRQRPGLGTLANALVVGPVIDLGIAWFPTADGLATQAAFAAAAILGSAVATGLYVGAGWGPGPRDGLMTGLAARGVPLGAARAGIELTVLVAGWLLGGTVGVATVAFALAIGPLVHRALPWLQIREAHARRPARPRGPGRGRRARAPGGARQARRGQPGLLRTVATSAGVLRSANEVKPASSTRAPLGRLDGVVGDDEQPRADGEEEPEVQLRVAEVRVQLVAHEQRQEADQR